MTRIILVGCNGRMGKLISEIAMEEDGVEIAAGIDIVDKGGAFYPFFTSLSDCNISADVMIDVSSAEGFEERIEYAVSKKLPTVLCTTGLSNGQLELIDRASESIAVLRSANMSLGINMLLKLLNDNAAKLAGDGFDVEIVEKHHNQKLDAPSGTALALADAVNESMDGKYEYIYDRSDVRKKRGENEIGISSIRGGTIVGEHDVIFAGRDEVITLSHTAYSRAVFAKGAVSAAKYMKGKKAGMYGMSDVLE